MVLAGDVVAHVAEPLLDAATVHHVQPAEPGANILARLQERLEAMGGHLRRDADLPAELADMGDPMRAGEADADLDLAGTAEGTGGGGEVVGAHARHQVARAAPSPPGRPPRR